ncbi:SLAM family member 5-like [Hyperolius riggenbachi]|uniref:SLAM family member 5-like n=1 Tax=Hyperolius riggenbachi TaxID=752182 RepID=UPI0035A2E427
MFRQIEILYILIAGKCILSKGKEDMPQSAIGLINQSIVLTLAVAPSHPVQSVFWNFQYYTLASYVDGHLTVVKNEYKGRLEILDHGRVLKIGQLRLSDTGLYTATIITFTDETNYASYNLTVYKPVPTPSVQLKDWLNTSDWCNMSIHCSVPLNTSSMSYTWKYKHKGSDYQVYNNTGDTVQMSLQNHFWDMEVLCIVQNPADQKNHSVPVPCKNDAKRDERKRSYAFLVLFLPLMLLLFFLITYYLAKVRKKQNTEVRKESQKEIHYADLKMTTPENTNQVHKKHNDPSQEDMNEHVTLYSMVRPTD